MNAPQIQGGAFMSVLKAALFSSVDMIYQSLRSTEELV